MPATPPAAWAPAGPALRADAGPVPGEASSGTVGAMYPSLHGPHHPDLGSEHQPLGTRLPSQQLRKPLSQSPDPSWSHQCQIIIREAGK